ncbi:helix-turn-helix transcriptional regulator [Paenibacillus antarcticus]|uniref:AraC family transcriptional regulator n=1 Tax=Paenibacillus antarcticus TaxID=253703 RepID=A0A162MFZ9_9BACL|nr:helix-turn-helix domain-containing protein [Paenibacillus antarcticus]OAB43933.1 AraC family transcriptional regulator [Paenibacillus antarcticus]
MDKLSDTYLLQRSAAFQEWSPSIHYAQFQRVGTSIFPKRRLYDFELLYVVQGHAVTTMHGQRFNIYAGQLIFLPSGVYHQNEIVSQPDARFIGIHFDFFHELNNMTEADLIVDEDDIHLNKFGLEACSDIFPPLSSQVIYTPSLVCVQLMEQLVEEFTMRKLGYELVCKSLMMNILVHLMRNSTSQSLITSSAHSTKLARIVEEIESAPSEPWSNQTIADALCLSIDYTAKLFKQTVGLPPSEYIQSIRHREARRLLRETDTTIEQIGAQVGYPDIHYFSRMFRRHEGITASEYRKLSRIL